MELLRKITLEEAVESYRRPWADWAHGEWITVPGLAHPDQGVGYGRFMRTMNTWAYRYGFLGNMKRIPATYDAQFRLRWRRPAGEVYLLKSARSVGWLGDSSKAGEAGRADKFSQFWRARRFGVTDAYEQCMAAAEAFKPADVVPAVLPVWCPELPMFVTVDQMCASVAVAQQRMEEALAGMVTTGWDPVSVQVGEMLARSRSAGPVPFRAAS